MTEILGASFSTVTDLVAAIRVAVDDTGTSNLKWTDDEIYLGIKQGISAAGDNFFVTDSYDVSLAADTRDYTLPDYVQRITRVERERRVPNIQVDANTTLDYEKLLSWTQFWSPGANTFHLERSQPDGTATIWYERDLAIPLVDLTLAAAISSTSATTMTVALPGSHSIYELQLPSWLQIDNAEIVKATAVTSANVVTIARGQLGTTAATASSGDTVTGVIVGGDDRLMMYLVNAAAAYLNMLVLQTGSRGSDVAGNLTAMREFQSRADMLLKRRPKRPKPRPILPERARRRSRY